MAKSKSIPKAVQVAPRDAARLKQMQARCMTLSRRRPRTAKGYMSNLCELTAIANEVVQMYTEVAHG